MDPDIDEPEDPNEDPNIRQLRRQNRKLNADVKALSGAQAKLEQLERQMAIRDAGLSLKPSQMKALHSVHEGEWSADAITATAVDLGFVAAKDDGPSAEEQARLSQITAASAGAHSSPPQADDVYARLRAATNEQQYDAIAREAGLIPSL